MNNLLIYSILKNTETGEETARTFTRWQDLHTATFNPLILDVFAIDFAVKGKTYTEKKENARQIAIDYSNNQALGLSWGELAEIRCKFETIGKRYGLLKEFKENAIC